ncbi:MAG: Rpn family recombination-promoting nuclease/putative transposase [Alphaproteobacteria bacterium]|nr:MAG: Rpn family recombination-promoting nuclease/putative transposase [Alphaproteobacteria bacterium]
MMPFLLVAFISLSSLHAPLHASWHASWKVAAEELCLVGSRAAGGSTRAVFWAKTPPKSARSVLAPWVGIVPGRGFATKPKRGPDNTRDSISAFPRGRQQDYTVPTFDAPFKLVLADDEVRPSFLHAFVPDIGIVESKRLDDHMNPLQEMQTLRTLLHRADTRQTVAELDGARQVQVHLQDTLEDELALHPQATQLLRRMVASFDDLVHAFPKVRYNGTMDFVCQLETGEYALIETQVIPQDYWDERALAYVAAFYGNQLRRGDHWRDLKKVIGINILAGVRGDHWRDTPEQYVRRYRMQEQLHTPRRFIDGIELVQYSLANAPAVVDSREQQDWLTFFTRAHLMSATEVEATIATPAVKRAFEMIRITNLPEDVHDAYVAEGLEYDRFSIYTAEEHARGKEEGLAQGKEEGLAQGRVEGKEEGAQEKLREVMARLARAGQTPAEIAALLDEDVTTVTTILHAEADSSKRA